MERKIKLCGETKAASNRSSVKRCHEKSQQKEPFRGTHKGITPFLAKPVGWMQSTLLIKLSSYKGISQELC